MDEVEEIVQLGNTSSETQHNGSQSQQPNLPFLELPESPLTLPRPLDARARYREEKPLRSKERTSFQLRLEKNPFALALATSPRQCLLTGLRMPSHFLIPFGLATHPETGAPWHLPKLEMQPTPSKSSEASSEATVNRTIPLSPQASSTTKPETLPASQQSTRAAAGTHFLASRKVLKDVSNLPANSYGRLLPFRWKDDSSIKTSEVVWRQDMDTFVLEILRKNVMQYLVYLPTRPAAYIVGCKDYESISKSHQIGAVLWLGSNPQDEGQKGLAKEGRESASAPEYSGPPPYAMHYYRSRYIPVYNLPTLLGPKNICTLRELKSKPYEGEYAVIKAKRPTMQARWKLWTLLGYLAGCEDEAANANELSDGTEFKQEIDLAAILDDDRFEEPLINVIAS
ncbi:hypothetical protein N7G274_009847 [Stereocaulon virgatum]|uniref:Uncharacterized protein n=1 Tax=Stereocaulon virgatum TaxID=373712 RepID=A0ABR3ZUT2_9LECA